MTTTSAVGDWTALVRQELPSAAAAQRFAWMALRACVGLTVVSFAVAAALLLAVLVVVGNVVRNGPAIVGNGVQCDARQLRYRDMRCVGGWHALGNVLMAVHRWVVGSSKA
ncbi:hypothetical protein [Rhodococcus sp. 008]|uniref:hypothetical protein n=1 Tax=Rhodococcus sp. 008 TaxID=1723645 RepID=UPI0012EA3D2A|nr:hypothetical protein [Rhodococcus sp. 008]